MDVNELDSFMNKFKQIWKSGRTAHLDVDTCAGQAWVGLRVRLGQVHGPHSQDQEGQHQPTNRNSPSRQRRRDRRAAERKAAAERQNASDNEVAEEELDVGAGILEASDNVNEAEEASTVVEEIVETSSDDNQVVKASETDSVVNLEDKIDESTEKAETCFMCDFESNWKNGLKIHMARKHCNIEQIDGNNSVASEEVDDDKKYSETYHYWKTGKLGTIYQSFLDANDIIEKSTLDEEDKMKEKQKILQARKLAFGNDFRYFPPWK